MTDKNEESTPAPSKRARSPEDSHTAEDDERPLKRQDRHDNESSGEEPPLPSSGLDKYLHVYQRDLERHITEERRSGAVSFFIECSKHLSGRASCKLYSCDQMIKSDEYRVAVDPGMWNYWGKADFYHVECFEKLADLTKEKYLDRLKPLSRNNFPERNANRSTMMRGFYLLNAGAERLILQWIFVMRKLIAKRDGTDGPKSQDPILHDLWYKSGSAKFTGAKKPEGMSQSEFRELQTTLAPIESDGTEDDNEWNLFDMFMTIQEDDEKCEEGKATLGNMLRSWRVCWTVANADEEMLDEAGKKLKEELGEKPIRAVKRLSKIPMPDLDSFIY